MRAGYLGPAGTFSHEALLASGHRDDLELVPLPTVHDTIAAVAGGAVDRGLVPIENSLEGGVSATLDTLATEAGGVAIVGEVVHPVRHCLVAREALEVGELRMVLSHPQAIGQCARFLRTRTPGASVMPAASTAEAVRMVAEGVEPGPAAAIGTRLAADLYGCEILCDGIEDEHGNVTRFVWLAREGVSAGTAGGPWKTTLVWWGAGDEAPGWLVRCLSEFAFRGVNLTRIESRPRRLGLGHYMFFVDLDGRVGESPVDGAIEGLHGQAETVRVLGSYPAARHDTPSS
jgi:prephenate dehydratase